MILSVIKYFLNTLRVFSVEIIAFVKYLNI